MDRRTFISSLAAALGLSLCRETPYDHQVYGISKLVSEPIFALFDEMGAGKTKQAIDAAQILFQRNVIDRVIVVCPASVRAVWFDPELGELIKHLRSDIKASVLEYHSPACHWEWMKDVPGKRLEWIVTNYEFIRKQPRLKELLSVASPRTLLILDESSAIKNYRAEQTKACLSLRKRCGRVLLLNGTPISHSPLDLFSQGRMMDPGTSIHGCAYIGTFRDRYCVMGGWEMREITGFKNLEHLQTKFAPYVLRRLKVDCLDLPEKLPPVTLQPPLSDETWRIYREMKREMVVWLNSTTVSVAKQAFVVTLRLGQITSGFLGGIEDVIPSEAEEEVEERPAWLPPPKERMCSSCAGPLIMFEGVRVCAEKCVWGHHPKIPVREISCEKQTFLFEWMKDRFAEDENMKLLVFAKWKPELFRLVAKAREVFPGLTVAQMMGGQKKAEREATMRLLHPMTAPPGPALVAATLGTGSKGLNFTASHTVVNLSLDYSLEKYLQSSDRVHRPGQVHPVSYFDIVATGPKGQKTIDHTIIKARRKKEDLATWTTAAWIRAIEEE